MIRHGYLFDRAFSKEALYQGYLDAAAGKRSKRACFQFEKRLGRNLHLLHSELHDGSYHPKPYYSFEVYEPKRRTIHAPAFRDTVVQHAIYRLIYPIFNPTFIDQSFACRKGMGTHAAADYAQHALQQSPRGSCTLKLDIRKFFYSIDRQILRQLVERKIKDRRFVEVVMLFADYGEPAGIPIGNLLSQIFALIYLNPLDHYVKRELRARRYCRYVDDFILFGLPREQCVELKADIERWLADNLKLRLSKWTIAPVRRGVNFVGYRTWASRRFVRKHSLHTFRQSAKARSLESLVACLGHARRTHSLQHMLRHLEKDHHDAYLQLPKTHRQRAHRRTDLSCDRRRRAHRGGARHTQWDHLCKLAG